MEPQRFDTFARLLARPTERRRLLLSLAMSPLAGIIAARHAEDAAARKKRKHKRKRKAKKVTPNEYGCLEVGDPCQVEEQCCSGICEGKKGKRKCRAHGIGTCSQDEPGVCEAGSPLDVLCNGAQCACIRTTGGSKYCATLGDPSTCADCARDADCEAQGFPPGSACVPFGGEYACTSQCASGMACVAPCGTPLPEG